MPRGDSCVVSMSGKANIIIKNKIGSKGKINSQESGAGLREEIGVLVEGISREIGEDDRFQSRW
jgi:hypothetical protein